MRPGTQDLPKSLGPHAGAHCFLEGTGTPRHRNATQHASDIEEIERANAVLATHALRERYVFRELPDSGPGNISRGNLALGYAPPSKLARAEYDLTVIASDGRITLLHRASGQRHQNLTVFTAFRTTRRARPGRACAALCRLCGVRRANGSERVRHALAPRKVGQVD